MDDRRVIQNGTVVDPATRLMAPRHILIEAGRIFGVTEEIPSDWESAQVVNAGGKWVLPGLICLRTHVGEPGEEWKEDVASAAKSAAAGGFTTICATPDTRPINDVRAVTEQIVSRSNAARGATVLPVGAATCNLAGEQLTEMGDLRDAGCVAVSTGTAAIPTARMMRRVLEYARTVGMPVFSVAEDPSLGDGAFVHEGLVALRTGLPAMPSEAESIIVYRDAAISKLASWSVHLQKISSQQGVDVLRHMRDQGAKVTADVTPHHLWFTDEAVVGYDTNTKVHPPLRSESDREALRAAVSDGLISVICTDHRPQSSIEKAVEYRFAEPGTTGLETALSVVLELCRQGVFDMNTGLERLTAGPADILGRTDIGRIADGARADLIIVDPETPRRVESDRMYTKSKNSIFEGVSLTGNVDLTLVGGEIAFDAEEPAHDDR
jgi:dihydroorotase